MGAAPKVSSDELEGGVLTRLALIEQRFTPHRRMLVEILRATDRPLTMPELLDQGRGLAQSSVYRNLVVLEQAGAVRRIVTDDEFARFELAEDLTGHHHHHLVCSACGAVEDVTVPDEIEMLLDSALVEIAGDRGFTVDTHRLDLVGRCADCA